MLWTPETSNEFLTITLDLSQSGDKEWEEMLMVNQASLDWLRGRLDTGTYFDILEHCGISPRNFVKKAENHIAKLIL